MTTALLTIQELLRPPYHSFWDTSRVVAAVSVVKHVRDGPVNHAFTDTLLAISGHLYLVLSTMVRRECMRRDRNTNCSAGYNSVLLRYC